MLKQCVQIHGQLAEVHLAWGRLLAESGKVDRALAAYRVGCERLPANLPLRRAEISLLIAAGRLTEARKAAEREAAVATAEARSAQATATAVASIGLTRDNPVPFGQAKVVPEGWEITVVEFTPDATQTVLAKDQFSNTPPDPGFKYVMVRVRATNVSAGDPADFDAINVLRLVGSRAVSYEQGTTGCVVTPDGLGVRVPSEAFSGTTVEGTVCFQVGADESGFVMFTNFRFGQGDRVYFSVE